MYNYANLKKLDQAVTVLEPSDNLIINGQPLNNLIEGYRHLTVSGRGLLGRNVSTTKVTGRRGVWVDDYEDEERTLEIKYQLTADTSAQMRDKFAKHTPQADSLKFLLGMNRNIFTMVTSTGQIALKKQT